DLTRNDMPAAARPFYRRWLQIQGRMLDRLVGMAPPMREEIGTLMRAEDARIAVIDDPSLAEADIRRLAAARDAGSAARQERAGKGGGRRFIGIGRLAAQKNFGLLIDAFARMAGPDDRLAIIGEGAARRALEAQIERLGLGAKVRLPGHVSPLDAELADADALVLSSVFEGVPAVVAEALAAGLPVVTTRCSVSMEDMLGGGRFGLLVPVGDAEALAQAMTDIARLPFDAAAARDQARRFTVEIASHRYRALMEDLARA
ncbi:MAG: glycosyltransferase, partial [Novosphingobium sp.]|nr:glycosyltransferase [Novosphingobium sp.]